MDHQNEKDEILNVCEEDTKWMWEEHVAKVEVMSTTYLSVVR